MSRHISKSQLNRYLDGVLDPAPRREVFQHLQRCPRCYQAMQAESAFRNQLDQDFRALYAQRPPDFGGMLPGILAEASTPTSHAVNRKAAALMLLLMMAVLLHWQSNLNLPRNDQRLFNVPLPSATATLYANTAPETKTPSPLPNSLGLKYASPVPPPQATATASVEPSH